MKRIGITQRVITADVGANRDSLEQDYVQYFEPFGVSLVPIPNVLENIDEWISTMQLDGFILSGGNDVNPKLWGDEPSEEDTFASERDETEQRVLNFAISKKLPVLTICRGTQFLNVAFGGKLKRIDTHVNPGHIAKNHEVELTDDVPVKSPMTVNSYHGWGFTKDMLAQPLKAWATAPDGFIEGVFHPELPIAGILWHPERTPPNEEFNKQLVNAFLKREWFWK